MPRGSKAEVIAMRRVWYAAVSSRHDFVTLLPACVMPLPRGAPHTEGIGNGDEAMRTKEFTRVRHEVAHDK